MDCEFTRSTGAILGVWTFFLPLTFIPTFITGIFFPILIPLQLFIIAFPFHYAKKNIVENKMIMEVMLSGLQHEVAKYNKPLIPRFYDNY
jgi:formate/nitrite transporter FocA (FNT family)